MNEILKCDRSNESYRAVLYSGTAGQEIVPVHYAVPKLVLTFEPVDEILKRDHSNENQHVADTQYFLAGTFGNGKLTLNLYIIT